MRGFSVYDRGAWMALAACADTDPEVVTFFPSREEDTTPAKMVCAECQVRCDCLDYVMSLNARTPGVWGGTSEKQRREMRVQRRLAA